MELKNSINDIVITLAEVLSQAEALGSCTYGTKSECNRASADIRLALGNAARAIKTVRADLTEAKIAAVAAVADNKSAVSIEKLERDAKISALKLAAAKGDEDAAIELSQLTAPVIDEGVYIDTESADEGDEEF